MCTQNPIAEDDKIIDRTKLQGKVTLDDDANLKDIFIWLQDTEATTRTDESGSFQIQIPSSSTQTGGGLNGIYNLYCYLANYTLDSVKVFLKDGLIEFNTNDIDGNGNIRKKIRLKKLLNISTSIEPTSITEDFVGYLLVTITLQATMDTVNVKVSQMTPYLYETVTKFLIYKKNNGTDYPKIIEHPMFKGTATKYYQITTTPTTIYLLCTWPPLTDRIFWTYDIGEYTIYPHIVVTTSQNIPEGLLEHIEGNFEEFSEEYIFYPLKYNIPISFTID